jgi:hypothetical protein
MKREVCLSEAQVLHLFDFVKSKYVHYIDVQHEIVDHLASAIEEEMENDESLNFEQALSLVYSRFPITGFAQFVGEKERALNQYWRKKVVSFFIGYLTPPKLLYSLILWGFIYGIIAVFHHLGVILMFLISCGIYWIYKRKERKLLIDIPNTKDLLFIKSFHDFSELLANVPVWIIIVFQPTNFRAAYANISLANLESFSPYALVVSIVFLFNFVFSHASYFEFPDMIRHEVIKKYKYLNLVITS